MRILVTTLLFSVLLSCKPASDGSSITAESAAAEETGTGSFDIRNAQIRDEMIQMISEAGIEHWVGENGAIFYNFADGEAVDRIGNEVIGEYITRN